MINSSSSSESDEFEPVNNLPISKMPAPVRFEKSQVCNHLSIMPNF